MQHSPQFSDSSHIATSLDGGDHVLDPSSSLEQAIAQLECVVEQWRFERPGLLRASLPVAEVDLLAWLEANPSAPRCYWQDRSDKIRLAGLGVAWQCVANEPDDQARLVQRAQQLARHSGVHLLCAFSFDGRAGREQWQGFPASLALLPAVELQSNGCGPLLSVNCYAEHAEALESGKAEVMQLLKQLRPARASSSRQARVTQRAENLDFSEYSNRLEAILSDIQRGHIHKAVLAREVTVMLDQPLPAFSTLGRWSAITNSCYCFAIEHAGRIFMGCSPERLFYRNGQSVQTESLAGTVRRGQTPSEDDALEAALLEDAKLVREHDWVTHHICDELEPWSVRIAAPEHPGVLKLDRIQHLRLPIEATLRPGVGDLHLLRALHPTAAVCGFPRDPARQLIGAQEGFQRGWYSGVVGLLSGDSSELAVAIRSVLVNGDQAWCFSGAGIVQGSEAETEWQELEAKIESFFAALQD